LGKADANFHVYRNGAKLGTVTISKGAIEWYPKKRSVNKIKLTWGRFDEMMRKAR
jgi:hypothetical protein